MNIDMNRTAEYRHASFRFFGENEHHIRRFCDDDVILLVFSGVLRFTEDGIAYEVLPGHYHIQKHATRQDGPLPSDAPKYLYIHCYLNETEGKGLPYTGVFDYEKCYPLMQRLDALAHGDSTLIEQEAVFLQILTELYRMRKVSSVADEIAAYLTAHHTERITLEQLADQFGYSRNRIISVFRAEYRTTPIVYLNRLRLQKAKHLMEVTSDSAENIAYAAGFGEYTQFYKLFERENGSSPSAWRKRMRER